MRITATSHSLAGHITVPGSKSHTIRALILATLADGTSTIHNPLPSADCLSTAAAVPLIGAEVDLNLETENQSGNDWIVCGQMYHYSAMQVGYQNTPSWYPSNASGDEFRADRYAWQNNLYDLLWMKTQGWVETYTDADGHSWQADYVYVGASVLDKVSSVEVLSAPVQGMLHKPIEVLLKY